MTRGKSVSERAQRLRDLADSAENIASLAVVADETLAKARRDVLALAGAARRIAEQLTAAADGAEVQP
jgi:hypothetical protein